MRMRWGGAFFLLGRDSMTGIGRSRWLFVVAAAVAAAVAVAVVAAGGQGNGSSSVSRFDPRKEAAFEGKGLEAQRKGPSNPATEQVENRAYPRAYVDDRLALKSHDAFDRKPEKLGSAAFATQTAFAASLAASPGAWSALGPVTPNVSGEASQFLDPVTLQGPTTQESGRVTALAIDPNCAKASAPATPATTAVKSFASPQQAVDSLIDAAEKFDVAALIQIFGPGSDTIVFSGEFAQDRKHAADFVTEAREKKSVSIDPKSGNRAFLLVGNEDWPFPVPIVKSGDKWSFDAKAGQRELLYRRIGANELDAIAICHGYVEAQYDYAFRKRQGYDVNQYAQRIISTPGKRDGPRGGEEAGNSRAPTRNEA
jgi:hypothetical protein